MRARALSALLAVIVGGASATVVACASDEVADESGPDASGTAIPSPEEDAGGDAALDPDAAAPVIPCTPDAVCPFGPFDPSTPGGALDPRTRISVIAARSESDVWLAGVNGTVAHWDGTSWRRSDTATSETMSGLWLRDGEEVAIAKLTSMYRRGADGGAPSASTDGWSVTLKPTGPLQLSSSTGEVHGTWATRDAPWLWAATFENSLRITSVDNVNGLWRLRVSPTTGDLELGNAFAPGTCLKLGCRRMSAIHGISADDLWAVGSTGATFHVTEAQATTPKIKPFDSQTLAELNGVWAASDKEAWSVGGLGTIRHFTGHDFAWEIVEGVPTTKTLRAIWGSSPTDVWAVGDEATVLHYDGTSWSAVSVAGLGARRPDLLTVWTPAPGRVWIGGHGVFLSLGGKP